MLGCKRHLITFNCYCVSSALNLPRSVQVIGVNLWSTLSLYSSREVSTKLLWVVCLLVFYSRGTANTTSPRMLCRDFATSTGTGVSWRISWWLSSCFFFLFWSFILHDCNRYLLNSMRLCWFHIQFCWSKTSLASIKKVHCKIFSGINIKYQCWTETLSKFDILAPLSTWFKCLMLETFSTRLTSTSRWEIKTSQCFTCDKQRKYG